MLHEHQWDAIATITVDGKQSGPFRLRKPERVTIGRSDRAGLHSPSPRIEVPRELARLMHTSLGWMLQNWGGTVGSEPKAVRVIGPSILSPTGALFAPRAVVLLAKGTWTLKWDVGVMVTVLLEPAEGDRETVGDAVDASRQSEGWGTIVAEPLALTELQRHKLTALFAYLLRDEAEPRDPYAEAARLLGGDVEARERWRNLVKAQFHQTAAKINRSRPAADALTSLEEVGHHLVVVTRTLSVTDLEG